MRQTATFAAASLAANHSFASIFEEFAKGSNIKLGYASITWGEDHRQFLKHVTPFGYKLIQLRNYLLQSYGKNPKELVDIMNQYKTKLAMYSFVLLGSPFIGLCIAKGPRHF